MADRTAVVFDLDDTLYAERRFVLSAQAALAAQLSRESGVPASALYRFLAGRFRSGGRDGLLQALCAAFALPAGEIPRMVDVIRTHPPRLRLPRASRDVLRALRGEGHRLGVLTNGLRCTQRGKVEALGLGALVDAVVYAEDHAPGGKPSPLCFAAILDRLGVSPARAVFVGDHVVKDVAGASAAGLSAIWMRRHGASQSPPEAAAVASRIDEVPALVALLLEERHVASC